MPDSTERDARHVRDRIIAQILRYPVVLGLLIGTAIEAIRLVVIVVEAYA